MISSPWFDEPDGESDYSIGSPSTAGCAWPLMTWRMTIAASWLIAIVLWLWLVSLQSLVSIRNELKPLSRRCSSLMIALAIFQMWLIIIRNGLMKKEFVS